MEWSVQLMTNGLNQWMEDAQQQLTMARDFVDILESEEAQLKENWKSSAMRQWEKEFHLLLAKIRKQLKEMQRLLLLLRDRADLLARMEKNMASAAEKI